MGSPQPRRPRGRKAVAMPQRGMDAPVVFVVTPCRNSERTIDVAIRSVLLQEPLEHYRIVDGASTDETVTLIERHASQDARLSYASEPDQGIYDAMNKGLAYVLERARPEDLVGILNSDDAYAPGALERVTREAAGHPEVDIFYGDIEMLRPDGSPTGRRRDSVPSLTKDAASDGMPLQHPAMFARARTYRSLGQYDTAYPIAADYDFVLRALDSGVKTLHISDVLAYFREGGVSTADELPSFKEAIRVRVSHGAKPIVEWARYYKRRLTARMFTALKWIPGVSSLQARYGASRKHTE